MALGATSAACARERVGFEPIPGTRRDVERFGATSPEIAYRLPLE
jgi:hypothetical protein